MEIELTFPPVCFAHPQCLEEGWHPEKSFHDYLMAVEIPDYFFSKTFGSHDKYRRYHEYNRVNLVNRLFAVQDDSKSWRLGLKKQTKPQLNFDKEEWDRIEQKLPDWFDEVLADEDEVVWHEAAGGTASPGAVSLVVAWLFSLQPERPEHVGLEDAPFEKRWRFRAEQHSVRYNCKTFEYVFSPTNVFEKELETKRLDGKIIKSEKKAKTAIGYMVQYTNYNLPWSTLQPTLLLRHNYLTESVGKTQAEKITLDSYETLNSHQVHGEEELPQVLFAVAFLMSTGFSASELKEPLAMDNPSIPEGWDWDIFKSLYQTVESPDEDEYSFDTYWGIRAPVHEVLATSSSWMNKFEQVPLHKHLAAWPWIVIWCIARDNRTRELETTTDTSSYHDDFAKDFPELIRTERNATVQLLSKIKDAVEQMHSMGGYQEVLVGVFLKKFPIPNFHGDIKDKWVKSGKIWWNLGDDHFFPGITQHENKLGL